MSKALAAIVIYFILAAIIVNPAGNLPLNDEWSYGLATKTLLETGQFSLPCYASCHLFIILGALASTIFGFSFTVLRSLSLVFGLLGTFGLYFCLKELQIPKTARFFLTFILAANPLFLNLSFSYMTDAAAICFTTWYLFFAIKILKQKTNTGYIYVAALFLILSLAVRQTAFVFIACNIVFLFQKYTNKRTLFSIIFGLIILPVAATFIFHHWMNITVQCPEINRAFENMHTDLLILYLKEPLKLIKEIIVRTGEIACYMALFSTPVLIASFTSLKNSGRGQSKNIIACTIVMATIITGISIQNLVFKKGLLMPFSSNLWNMPYLGAYNIIGDIGHHASKSFRYFITCLSAIMAITFLSYLAMGFNKAWTLCKEKWNQKDLDSSYIFCFLALLANLAILILQIAVRDFDRYYLIVLCPSIICLAIAIKELDLKINPIIATTLLVILGTYSIFSTQDCLNWNRARSILVQRILDKNITAENIDAGPEFNFFTNLKLYNKLEIANGLVRFPEQYCGGPNTRIWRWWPIASEKYVVSFSAIDGYHIIDSQDYWSPLFLKPRHIFLLEQNY